MNPLRLFPALVFLAAAAPAGAADPLRALIVDGQNNHAWPQTTPVLRAILEESGRFTVTVSTSPPGAPRPPAPPKDKDPGKLAAWKAAYQRWETEKAAQAESARAAWDAWRPEFAAFDVVVSNYNGEPWPEPVRRALEAHVGGGGGFVAVHAANNAHPEWKAYNEMIAVGGWGGRSEVSGPYLRWRDGGWAKDPTPGRGGSHGAKHEFVVETRAADHPIMKGLPERWLHATDELYDRLRGPAANVTVLASAYADPGKGGSGEHEPILMAIEYGKGRVFHTTLGHDATAMGDVGFAETLRRGAEWAATGAVTFPPVPAARMPADRVGMPEGNPAPPAAAK